MLHTYVLHRHLVFARLNLNLHRLASNLRPDFSEGRQRRTDVRSDRSMAGGRGASIS